MTIKEQLREAYKLISAADADILLAYVLGETKAKLYSRAEESITDEHKNQFAELLTKRQAGTPVAYLTSTKEFYGRQFKVTPAVLIPRPDSELLIETALEFLKKELPATSYQLPAILDIGTGSGCLIITLALETNNQFTYTGLDISDQALTIAKENARTLDAKVNFIQSNLLTAFQTPNNYKLSRLNYSIQMKAGPRQRRWQATSYQLIIANLPYLTAEQMQEPSIQAEPALALEGGEDGLFFYRQLLPQLPALKPRVVLLEIDPNQETAIRLESNKKLPGWQITFKKDLSGKTRVAILTLSSETQHHPN